MGKKESSALKDFVEENVTAERLREIVLELFASSKHEKKAFSTIDFFPVLVLLVFSKSLQSFAQ